VENIKMQQKEDLEPMKIKEEVDEERSKGFFLQEDELWHQNQLFIPITLNLRK